MSVTLLLLQLSVILLSAWASGAVLRALGQPAVIGEIAAGVALGPMVFGKLAPDLQSTLFEAGHLTAVDGIGQIGLVLFMFSTGVELREVLSNKKQLMASGSIAATSFVIPFAVGLVLAGYLYKTAAQPGVSPWLFAFFMGCALSTTALPVMARILKELEMTRSEPGALALSAAAIADIPSWFLLLAVTTVMRGGDNTSLAVRATLLVVFTAMMLLLLLPSPRRLMGAYLAKPRAHAVWQGLLLPGVVLCAAGTEVLGAQAAFGALLFGVCAPRPANAASGEPDPFGTIVRTLLLPVFFASTGLHAVIAVRSWENVALFGLILIGAVGGKLVGAAIGARLFGHPWRITLSVGALLNSRGLMELVVINIGLQAGIIQPSLFTMLLLMAVLTTLMTAPTVRLLGRAPPPLEGTAARPYP